VIFNALRALGAGFNANAAIKLQGSHVDELKREHADLAELLESVNNMANEFSTLPMAQAQKKLQRLLTMLETKLIPHEQADESELYPLLARHLKGEDPMAALSHTHREIFRLVKLLGRMSSDFSADGAALSQDEIRQTLLRLDTVLELHFQLENELFHNLDNR
jgi:iron-sulfur cluster repair protein YtfE (RIC family)